MDEAIAEVETTSQLSGGMQSRLVREFSRGGNSLLDFSGDDQEAVLQVLKVEREELRSVLDQVDRRAAEAIDAARAGASLPSDQDVLRIQRYETMYERQLYQAINQVERLQRRRLGELSAPPISVNVTRED
jgi:hypothetical protein